jgi:hypothetical protein
MVVCTVAQPVEDINSRAAGKLRGEQIFLPGSNPPILNLRL